MKVCMFCQGLGGATGKPSIGGQGKVLRLIRELVRRKHKITLITTPYPYSKDFKLVESVDGVKVITLPMRSFHSHLYRRGFEILLKGMRELKELSYIETFNLFHGHSGYAELGLLTRFAGKVLKVPTVHSLYCANQGWKYKLLKPFFLSRIDRFICPSLNVKLSLKNLGIPNDLIDLIPPGLNLPPLDPELSKELTSEFSLLYIGDSTKGRGLDILLEALNKVKKQVCEIKLLLGINMPLESYKESNLRKRKIRELGLEGNVISLGLVKDMPQVMKNSGALVAPFTSIEGIFDYPISILEAMALGKPVIASKVGGIPEIIKDKENGLLVEPGNPSKLAEAILYAFRNKGECKKMGEKAKLMVKDFTLEAEAEKIENLYKKVAGR